MVRVARTIALTIMVTILALIFGVYLPARRGTPIVYGNGEGEVYPIPSRDEMIARTDSEEFDLVIIGGGATGVAAALEARARGLTVALFEAHDFAAGTSSRSTKLLHGGVRYLRKAFVKRDASQYHLVREALAERHALFTMAPHLSRPLPIVTPLYSWKEVPGNYMLLKAYDWLSFPKLASSAWYTPAHVARDLPAINTEGLIGGVAYYDGVFDDARMAVAFALGAAHDGAVVLNHAKVVAISHGADGRVNGVTYRDEETGLEHAVACKGIVNAAGHFADEIRMMDNADAKSILVASSGVHIVLDGKYTSASHAGILIPKTEDGRVVFIHPWHGHSLVGTTDGPSRIEDNPRPSAEAVAYLLDHAKRTLPGLTDAKVLSAWAGIRPLKRAEDGQDTASVSREHAIYASPSGLLTIVGGKWTTTRKMAEDVINRAAEEYNLDAPMTVTTKDVKLPGALNYNPSWNTSAAAVATGLPADVLAHLNESFGDQAPHIAALAVAKPELAARFAPGLPFIVAEVHWTIDHEYARDVVDVVYRRMALALVDNGAANAAVEAVADICADKLGWTPARRTAAVAAAREYLDVGLAN